MSFTCMDKKTYLAIGAFGMHNFVLFCSFLISIRALASHFIGFLAFLFFPETKSGLPSLFDLQAVTCKGGGCTLNGIFKFTICSILWIYLNSSVHFKKTENHKTNFKSTDLILFRHNLWGYPLVPLLMVQPLLNCSCSNSMSCLKC